MIRFSSSCFSWLKRFVAPSGGCQSDLSPDEEEEKEHSNKRGGGCHSDLSPDEEEEQSNTRGGGCQSDLSSEEVEDKFMEPTGKIVINISSDDEEEEHSNKWGGGCQSDLKQQIKEELDDDCVILDGDPNKPLGVVGNESGSESDELVIVAEKGQVACRDYPHARHLCARFPFNTNPHEKYCALCHCYVCDTLAPCGHWGRGMSRGDHCHATDKEEIWRALRQCSKIGEGAQLLALNHPVNTPSNAPILHPTTASGEGAQLPALNHPVNTPSNAPNLHPTIASWEGAQLPALNHLVNTPSNAPILHPTTGPTTASCEGAQRPALNHPVNTPSNAPILHPTTGPTIASWERAQLPALNHPVNTPSNAPILHPTTGPTTASCEEAQLPALNHPVNTPSNAPILHPTTGPSRPMSGGEGRAVTVGLMVSAFDQLTVQTDRLTGTVKWFDWRRGYGFITPDGGGEDLFVHRSSIKSAGYRILAEGDAVEFCIERRDDGRKAAVEVIGLGMSFVQETTTRGSDLIDSRKCYKCGETGHLARNCVVCYNCGKTGHLARSCSCTGSETDGNDSDGSDTGRYNNCPNMGSESDDEEDNTCSDTRRSNYCSDTRECYNCGRTGHLARNCSFSECRSSDTDNNDSDTSEGDQLVVQAEILTGTVKWFSNEKGYGFITPDGGGEDLFVHQSSIKSKGYRSLAQGEVIEFQIERGDDGRKKAVDVTGPGGSFVQGTARRRPYH